MSLDRERWQEVSPYLDRAMEMGDEELAAWLVSLRAERPSLASDLEGLLADRVAIARESFLEDTAVPLMRPSHPSSLPSKGDAVDGADRSRTPASLGSYRLIRRLGEGGMGIVYLAEQSGPITREVALKVIRPGLDSEKVLARFSSERQILANLSHPGISRVYDAGATPDGRPYVAMEYVPGTSLTRFCDEARMPVRERLELFLQVCAAIQHAHQKGVIHRDIKPSNLLVSIADGRPFVKVIDFGIAKALTPHPGDEMLTQTGATLGTPEYMSPEQASGDPGAVDTRSDVYALGVVLYELLAGARPFEMADLPRATPLALLEAMRDKDPPRLTTRLSGLGTPGEIAARRGTDPRRLARQLEGELEWITLRALEKVPSRRYASAAELGADIERHLKGEPVLAGPPSTLYRLNKLVRRHRVAATALAVVAITVTAGAVISTLFLLRAVRAERLSQEQLHDSLYSQALILTHSTELGRRGRAVSTLEKVASIRPGIEARNTAIAALSAPGFRVVREFVPKGGDSLLAWPDTRLARYAAYRTDGTLTVHAIDDDRELFRLPQVSSPTIRVEFSPDGSLLAVHGRDRKVRLWDLSTRTQRHVLGPGASYAFTPDGNQILAHSLDRPHIYDVATGRVTVVNQRGPYSGYGPPAHPTEPLFFAPVYGSDEIEFRRTVDGSLVRRQRVPQLGLVCRWSADGRFLITTHLDYSIRVWDWPAMGAPRLILRHHTSEPSFVETDPSGRLLATSGWDFKIAIFDLHDGRLLLSQPGSRVMAARDRTAFLLADAARWRLVEPEPEVVLETVPIHELWKSPRDVDFSSDGRWVATSGEDGVKLLDRRTRAVHDLLHGQVVLRVGFSADSREVHVVTETGLRIWRVTEDPAVGRVPAEPVVLASGTDRPVRTRSTGGVSPDGQRWLILEPAPSGERSMSLVHGVFGEAESESVPGLPWESNAPEISADGRWLACGNWHGRDAVVMARGSSGPPIVLPTEGSASVAFSPDSRLLAVSGLGEIRFYEVGSWRLKHAVGRPVDTRPRTFAFTSDSRLCAVSSRDEVQLIDVETGEALATLPSETRALGRMAFSPDDRCLAVTSFDHQLLLWDLVALRGELRRIGLDWRAAAD